MAFADLIVSPEWRVVRWCDGGVLSYIPPMSSDPMDHFWYTVEVFKMREAWKKEPTDNWMLRYYHNQSGYVFFETFEHRREALRTLGFWCREYILHAQARYEQLAEDTKDRTT